MMKKKRKTVGDAARASVGATVGATVGDLAAAMEKLAPLHLAEAWDNVGLLAGDAGQRLRRVLLAIDLTPAVYAEVIAARAGALVVYHPPIFKPLKNLRVSSQEPPHLAIQLLQKNVAIYAPHTALDVAAGGTNDVLAGLVGAEVTGSFAPSAAKGKYLKLVAFVPESHVEQVSDAVFAAGAGNIGVQSTYRRCSFRTAGVGTFQGDEKSHPAVGLAGVFEKVPEIRLETILPAEAAGAVAAALRAKHPYEEPAFDLLEMVTLPENVGLGRYAELRAGMTLGALAGELKRRLGSGAVQVIGDAGRKVRRLAILAGSAGRHALDHATERYDVLVTGELKHHDMLAYQAAGIAVVCVGHWESERPVLGVVRAHLTKHLAGVEVRISRTDGAPAHVL